MKAVISWVLLLSSAVFAAGQQRATITVDYPLDASVFPPEFPPPTFLWRDPAAGVKTWEISVKPADGSQELRAESRGEPFTFGAIDPRCVSPTNELPKPTPEQAAAHTWKPDPDIWAAIKEHSRERPVTITITGFRKGKNSQPVSRGVVTIQTSKDPVSAPIFYRDVPLMPADTEKGVIKPLVPEAIPLIAWRLRDVSQPTSRLLMQGLPTCANCHSVSADGTTMGMDVDGPQNDKGLYAVFPIKSHTSIRREDVITWKNVYTGKLGGKLRVGFMSQISPDGRIVMTTINDPGVAQTESQRRTRPQDLIGNYFVTNFKDFRFGQVFYPTRGILAWYSQEVGKLQPLPGADDPRYVQTGATWSPDGKYLVFSRAEARDAYPPGAKVAKYANDPNETQIQYDLYRIPFNGGKGGRAEPLEGASQNGMSNNFPKISPDGRWVVFVQCRNGQLMRPDSQLYIVPTAGGKARRMRCNTPLMNSWHSFSPNGRWLVFSSKSRSPYTQMYLTHIDEGGNDTPPVLIEDATAANRAINIPEFINVSPGGLAQMDAPATEFYRLFDLAAGLVEKGKYEEAIPEFRRALELNPEDVRSHSKLGVALAGVGRIDEAITEYRKAMELDPSYGDAYSKLGLALARLGKPDEARRQFEKALELFPESAEAHSNLAAVLLGEGRFQEAIDHCEKALAIDSGYAGAHANFAMALARLGKTDEAIPHFEQALSADPDSGELHLEFGRLLAEKLRFDEAIPHLEKAATASPGSAPLHYNLARILAAKGRFEAAVDHLEKVVEIAPDFAQARYDLINALDALSVQYAGAGRMNDALEAARRALGLARQQNNQALAAALEARIARYQADAR